MPRYSIATLILVNVTLAAMLAAQTPAPFAPKPRVAAAQPDDGPDPIFRLPDDELVPEELWASAADVADVVDWGHAAIGVSDAWLKTKGKGATVAVLDTGCDPEHRDLKAQILKARDFTGSRSGAADVQGHGTHCAGVVLAAENGVGMVGVAPHSRLLVAKVLGDTGSGAGSWIANGIDWSVAEGADVISMSLGSPGPDPRIHAAVKRAEAAGVIVIAAAGNEGPREGTVGFPGGHPESICVAATDAQGRVANFSSRGPRVDVAAPGVAVRSCYPGDRFATMSGTSMATPYVAGVAALYVSDCKARGVKPSPAEFRRLVTGTARDVAPVGKDNASGHGLVQPAKLLTGAPPKLPPDPPTLGDRWEILIPESMAGRKIKRIVVEFEKP